jgi:hypothetical protein
MTVLAKASSNITDRPPWRLAVGSQFISARELAAEGSIGWSQRSEYEVGVRWSPPCEDASPEVEKRRP